MRGDHHLVEAFARSAGQPQLGPIGVTPDTGHAHALAHLAREGLGQPGHVGPGATLDCAPQAPTDKAHHAVVQEETDQRCGRIGPDLVERRGPDRGRLGQEVIVAKSGAVALGRQVVVQWGGVSLKVGDIAGRGAEEALDIQQQPPEPGRQQVALLGEDTPQPKAGILERAVIQRDTERHVGVQAGHAKMRQQRREIGIVGLVVDNKAGIDGRRPVMALNVGGVSVTAQPVVSFEQRHVVLLREQPGRRKACDARADHRHAQPLVRTRFQAGKPLSERLNRVPFPRARA